jgi:glyoxylase-like metal-dependent hydrolase (beta-lactamase superfamily II)
MKFNKIFQLGIFVLLIGGYAQAQEENWTQKEWDQVELKTEHVAGNIHVVFGLWHGNSGISVGQDGILLIDDQFAPLTNKLTDTIADISSKNIKYVINTHSHTDHIGGNAKLIKQGAAVIAHEKVRENMENDHEDFMMNTPSSPDGLPTITYNNRLNLYFNDEEVQIIHIKNAHTDNDSIIYFKGSNVIHMGDIYFTSGLPYIDIEIGGDIDGMINAVEVALTMSNEQTKVIAGHGPVSDSKGLKQYLAMLKVSRSTINDAKKHGKSLLDIQNKPDFFLRTLEKPWNSNSVGGLNHFISSVFKTI